MAQYIDKSALVAEIERLEKKNNESENVYDFGTECALKSILSFIDTIEVKEVDLDTEIMKYQREIYDRDTTVRDVAKYFFKLGMSVSNKAKKGEKI